MKKIFIAILLLSSCTEIPKKREEPKELSKGSNTNRVTEYTYEGCEYIVIRDLSRSSWGSHKGNCKNPIHSKN